GLRTVHAHCLDDLAVARADCKPTVPAGFLSGNGPLVEVLQHELRATGGSGKTFVRGVKDYVERYSGTRAVVPPEHVLVFDEAQRAVDADQVAAKHPGEHPSPSPNTSSSSPNVSPSGAWWSDSSEVVRRSTSARKPASFNGDGPSSAHDGAASGP